jgi:hypothetical protein
MNKLTYSVMIDWDCTDWAADPQFTTDTTGMRDVTSYVKPPIRISRGSKPEDWVYPAATLELKLNNTSGVFYPTLATGALYALIRLWLPIKIVATHLLIDYPLYYGYICGYAASPLNSNQDIYIYATDGMDVLAKQIVIQNMDSKLAMSDGAAIIAVLDAAGWGTRRIIDLTGEDIIRMPETFAYEAP